MAGFPTPACACVVVKGRRLLAAARAVVVGEGESRRCVAGAFFREGGDGKDDGGGPTGNGRAKGRLEGKIFGVVPNRVT